MSTEFIAAGRDTSGCYKVDVSRGENVDRLRSEWFSRPDDDRYPSLHDLFASLKGPAERSRTRTVESAAIADSSPAPFIDGIRAAREKIVARTDEGHQDFLRKRGVSKAEMARFVETVPAEDGRPPESVFDVVQGITAVARSTPQQSAGLVLEGKAKVQLEKV